MSHHPGVSNITTAADEVVLLDEAGEPCGATSVTTVHGAHTPLHLAFSSYLFNRRGEVLLTRRALTKRTWPGVWTNSCCGHPRPGEELTDAVCRRVHEELGLTVLEVKPLLPQFRYRAVDASGMVENEVCPVFAGLVAENAKPEPNPLEVAQWAWVPWQHLVAAMTATPQVFSPWAAMQVQQIDASVGGNPFSDSGETPEVGHTIHEVDHLLHEEVETLTTRWREVATGLALDVLPQDLPQWLSSLLVGRGKRVRVAMMHWGYFAAGGATTSTGYRNLVRAAAALETLHLFALIHDDVMDESDTRRGRPSAHVQAAHWHAAAHAHGDRELFGRNLAILLGDLAHTIADHLIEPLPSPLREVWHELSVELIAGQRADLTGAAAGRRDQAHAQCVARAKSGQYAIVRPLQLGALAAGASQSVVAGLMRCGEHLGRAFALRDDYLGVWGDPTVTGKPAGDDLYEGKATVLLALAREHLTGTDAERLRRVGTPDFNRSDAPVLAEAMRQAGVQAAADRMIASHVQAGVSLLNSLTLTPTGLAGIRRAATEIAWRDA